MAARQITVDGECWDVIPSGRVTSYARDEFGLLFQQGTGPERRRRYVRYSPLGARRWDAALAELTDAQLVELFRHSQPPWTSPDERLARAVERGGR